MLYKDFIISASKAYGDAMVSNDPQIPVIVDLYAMISIMRVMSLPQTLASAEKVMHATTQVYFEPNRTVRELHDRVMNGNAVDPLKEFSEAARNELRGRRSAGGARQMGDAVGLGAAVFRDRRYPWLSAAIPGVASCARRLD